MNKMLAGFDGLNNLPYGLSFPTEEMTDQEILQALYSQSSWDGFNVRGFDNGLLLKAPQQLARYQFAQGSRHKRLILSFDKGMGKTLTYLLCAKDAGFDKLIILCTKSAMLTQLKHIRIYFPEWVLKKYSTNGNQSRIHSLLSLSQYHQARM